MLTLRLLFRVIVLVVTKVAGWPRLLVSSVKFVVGEPGTAPKLLSELIDSVPILIVVPPV